MAAPSLTQVRVHEAMHPSIIGVDPETTPGQVAKSTGEYWVRAAGIISTRTDHCPPGILSALDVVAAAAMGSARTAAELAATEVLTISSGDRLDHAEQLIAEHELSHLIVIMPPPGSRPAGSRCSM